ncbi:hypothetical protein SteCoe_28410 [Stentor coeruleus]|uniref:Dipeptidyl peptidase 1 n=1 Tax=Stentor coeruleus TaxID=5963 RepID=A0A1R2B8D2_9CILI|nr:hypothetical protein SteCoe_28410 [Stentor coeruleus]
MLEFLLITLALADLPIHCTYKQLLGEWDFFLDSETFEASLDNPKTYCGHGRPGNKLSLEKDQQFQFEKEFITSVVFEEPNYAYSLEYGAGTWTLIYDEGFILEFPDKSFTTNFFYYKQGTSYKSNCGRTTIGWYRGGDSKDLSNWGCFYAEKKTEEELVDSNMPEINWISPEYMSFLQIPDKLYEDYQDRVDHINSIQTSWTAGINPKFKGMTMMQLNQKVGTKQRTLTSDIVKPNIPDINQYKDLDFSRLSQTDHESLIYFWDIPSGVLPSDALPKNWDWSNINGVSYVTDKIRDQGNCGSCYAITTVEMLESRLRVLTDNKFKDYLSEQYLLSCSFYTEGCSGGYPTLLNKFIQEFYVVKEECMEYKGREVECQTTCEIKEKVGVSDYYYIGGYYGATDEESLMKELRARGPVIADFNPDSDYLFYSNGIYESVSLRKAESFISDDSMRDYHLEWEEVSHSSLLVGWGEENGQKYWKCLNSWGQDWGENGYFRIKRGVDESSIESMGEAATPYIITL